MCGLLIASAIAVSRVVLHAHSVAEALAGFLLGSVAVLCFLRRMGARWQLHGRAAHLALSLLLLMPFVYGHRFPSERLLRFAAEHLSLDNTLYTRRFF